MKISTFILSLFITIVATLQTEAQDTDAKRTYSGSTIGLDMQVYPTGIIPGIRYEAPLSTKSNLYLRAGYQIIDHRDLGVQDDETGTGYGFSLGYRRFFNETRTKWSLMLKTDVWFNTIDWTNEMLATTGTTEIVVLQPTAQLEYAFDLGERLVLAPNVAFGLEWNVSTDGEPTGEGPILLLGVALAYKL